MAVLRLNEDYQGYLGFSCDSSFQWYRTCVTMSTRCQYKQKLEEAGQVSLAMPSPVTYTHFSFLRWILQSGLFWSTTILLQSAPSWPFWTTWSLYVCTITELTLLKKIVKWLLFMSSFGSYPTF